MTTSVSFERPSKNAVVDIVKDLIDQDGLDLPMLSETAAKLLRICNDKDRPPSELAECIRMDPSLASHVLRIANSAMYSGGTPIVSLQQAVARLGIFKLREIALLVSCQERVFDVKAFDAEVKESFRQSLRVGVVSQELARVRRLNVEDAFLCGLLHDVGRPIVLQLIVDYEDQDLTADREACIDAVEHFRAHVAGNLIEAWKLPHDVAEAVRQQSLENAIEGTASAQLLCFAILCATALDDDPSQDTDQLTQHPLVESLNLYPDQVSTALDRSVEAIDLMGSAI